MMKPDRNCIRTPAAIIAAAVIKPREMADLSVSVAVSRMIRAVMETRVIARLSGELS
jgi:hypothetical protein